MVQLAFVKFTEHPHKSLYAPTAWLLKFDWHTGYRATGANFADCPHSEVDSEHLVGCPVALSLNYIAGALDGICSIKGSSNTLYGTHFGNTGAQVFVT